MKPPLRTVLEPAALCPRGPAPHCRRPPRQDRQARRPPRAQQEEEEEMNATIYPAKADYAVLSDTDTVRLQRVLPGPIERVWQHTTDAGLRRQWLAGGDDVQPRAGRSDEHTSELQSLMRISYAVLRLKQNTPYPHNVTRPQHIE